jgi:sugar O-acyltransferase (sialic acid O-acetyltransferase NeuD family)
MSETGTAVVIYGAGGHGKVVLDALERSGRQVAGFLDDDAARGAAEYCGYAVVTGLENAEFGVDFEVVVAIGDGEVRSKVTDRIIEKGYRLATAIHPSATIGRDVEIGPGAMVLAQSAVNPGARIGRGAIVNTGATIDHDCVVGDFAHVAPGARLAGNVTIGDSALIGVGATVIPGVKIGSGSTVGAGAVVVADVAAGTTVAGVPASAREKRKDKEK